VIRDGVELQANFTATINIDLAVGGSRAMQQTYFAVRGQGGEQGGPIVKNKVWFFGAFRKARYDRPIANTFIIPLGQNVPQAFAACRANPDSCEQGVSDEKMDNPVVRLTWQASERNKVAVYMDRALRLRGHAMGALTDQNTATPIACSTATRVKARSRGKSSSRPRWSTRCPGTAFR